MRMRMEAGEGTRAPLGPPGPLLGWRHDRAEISPARAVDGPRGDPRGATRAALPRPRDRRAAGGGRQAAAAAALHLPAPLGRRDAALLQLVRPALAEGPQRLPDVRP